MNTRTRRAVYGRDHEKTQKVLKKNRDNNPSVTKEDIFRWEQLEEERKATEGLRNWGRESHRGA